MQGQTKNSLKCLNEASSTDLFESKTIKAEGEVAFRVSPFLVLISTSYQRKLSYHTCSFFYSAQWLYGKIKRGNDIYRNDKYILTTQKRDLSREAPCTVPCNNCWENYYKDGAFVIIRVVAFQKLKANTMTEATSNDRFELKII